MEQDIDSQQQLQRIVEAAIMAAPQPLTTVQLYALFPEEDPAVTGSIEQAISILQDGCAERGVELVEVASGYRYQVKADVHPHVSRLWAERQTKYTRATLETLALIAYRQPITRGEIEQIRGVGVNANMIKALEEREWIRVVGHRDVPGRPELFGTTRTFLDYFGLRRLDELPPLAELKEIPELEPQLPFDITVPAIASAVLAALPDVGSDNANDDAGNEYQADEPAFNDDGSDHDSAVAMTSPAHERANVASTGPAEAASPSTDEAGNHAAPEQNP